MTNLIMILMLIGCVVLGFFILIQKPKGGGLSGAFGSIGSQVMGVKQSGDAMEKGTCYPMLIIALLSISSVFTLNIQRTPRHAKPQNTQQPVQQQVPAPQQ